MMVQSEKMLSVGGLAAGMAHEINNPLGGMMQTAEVLSIRLGDIHLPANITAAKEVGTTIESIKNFMEKRKILKMVNRIRESGYRASGIVDNMLSFARKAPSKKTAHHLFEIVEKCIELSNIDYDLKKKFDFKNIEIVRDYKPNLPKVPCDASKIQQVVINILRNGAEAMNEIQKKDPKFTIRLFHRIEDNMVVLKIEDNGSGMEEAVLRRIFEPFYTTKATDAGTGLGLSVSYFIITENHHGQINVESEKGKSTTFTIALPAEHPAN
ncbi:MAG: GHKL domain-containing protein [Deltaproteobacteria bacterium]|nr:GHKL domain-containing protein [Deltaproteobacteria bacterium]